MKLHIQERYRNDKHYVWCSEHFDATALPRYVAGAQIPPSSNPSDIYKDLKSSIARNDQHCSKIIEQRATLAALATNWGINGEISGQDKDDILWLLANAPLTEWRPMIYVMPRALINPSRLMAVPAHKRAGLGMEYIIADLARDEFDLIEI